MQFVLKGTGIEAFTFGVNARNPFVFVADGKFIKPKHGLANNKYGDPEANYTTGNAQGLMNIGQYPTTRTYGFTVNLTFIGSFSFIFYFPFLLLYFN